MIQPDSSVVPDYLVDQTNRLSENLVRVDSLLDTHEYLDNLIKKWQEGRKNGSSRLPEVDDILRSAIVLLHASLEDFLRSIASAHLPKTNGAVLKEVPLAGYGHVHAKKYTLGDLITHRGKQVDAVIAESIDQWLQQQSFNSCSDVAAMLKNLEIPIDSCNATFAALDEMIKRRHRIVHNADRATSSVQSSEILPIDRETLKRWRAAVQQFMQAALYQLHLVVEGNAQNSS